MLGFDFPTEYKIDELRPLAAEKVSMFARILASFASALVLFGVAHAQNYPNKSVRIIVPFATGGPDTVARLVGARLSERLGQTFVIENRPAANGIVGTDTVAKAPPDGYTLLIHSSGIVGTPSLQKKLPYDTERDLVPITNIAANIGTYLVVHPSVPANSVREFIELARKPDARIAFSSPGLGNTLHLIGELFNERAGIKMLHVPYKGGGPAIAAVISGEVQAMLAPPQVALANVRAGKLRALATTWPTRTEQLPEVPTMAEAGVANLIADGGWFGMFAPAGTPVDIVNRLYAEVKAIVAEPAVRERLLGIGLQPVGMPPAEFKPFVAEEIKKYAEMARIAGVQPE